MDAIPFLSQLKSLVQAACGQTEDAWQTQINFTRQCPVVSQYRSAVEMIMGDEEAALETQKECGRFALGVIESLPVVGHVSGGIHYAVGDKDGGDKAMKAASHSTAVIGGGIGGFFIGGPVGAVGLGISAGVAMDSAITGIDTAVHWDEEEEVRTYGLYVPFSDPTNPGKWVDAAFGVALDGFAGHGAGSSAVKAGMRNGARRSSVRPVEGIRAINEINPAASSKVLNRAVYITKAELKSIPKTTVHNAIRSDVVKYLDPDETDDECSD